MTDAEYLVAIDTAIEATLTRNAQALAAANQSLTSLPIDRLHAMRNEVKARVDGAALGGRSMVARFRSPA